MTRQGSRTFTASLRLGGMGVAYALEVACCYGRCGGCVCCVCGSDNSASFEGVGQDAGAVDRQHSDVASAHSAVGAFDVTVLEPTSADDVTAWLETNGFLTDANAPPILADYVASGH